MSDRQKRTPLVAIIGRPNVGKSTLFNRLLKQRRAIVDDRPGVTRDRVYGDLVWQGKRLTMVDTGGFVTRVEDPIELAVRGQASIAIAEADQILFVVDREVGPTAEDAEIAQLIRESGKPSLLVVNKVDSEAGMSEVTEFYSLGLGDPAPTSAINGRLSGDLLDRVVEKLPMVGDAEELPESAVRVAVVGRPNVGKSTFVNTLVGHEKSIVDSRPGTTRDPVDSAILRNDRVFVLIDTAGLRRRAKAMDQMEAASALRTRRSLEICDVALVLVDAWDGLVSQDARILSDALDQGKGAVLAVNKWDLVEKDETTAALYAKRVRDEFPFADHVPIVFTSGLTRQRVFKALDVVSTVADNRNRKVGTPELNRALQALTQRVAPPSHRGRSSNVLYAVQQRVRPPGFMLFVNDPELIGASYRQYLTKGLREAFGLAGTPIRLILKKK